MRYLSLEEGGGAIKQSHFKEAVVVLGKHPLLTCIPKPAGKEFPCSKELSQALPFITILHTARQSH